MDGWDWGTPEEPQRLSERATAAWMALIDRQIHDILTGSTDTASTLFAAREVRACVFNAFESRAIVRRCFETLPAFEHHVGDAHVVSTSQNNCLCHDRVSANGSYGVAHIIYQRSSADGRRERMAECMRAEPSLSALSLRRLTYRSRMFVRA
jgi:hypothetical protein